MSNIKERILGAVTVMSDKDANALWKIILNNFSPWEDIEEITPDEIDTEMLKDIQSNPDCHSFVSQEEVMRELGL